MIKVYSAEGPMDAHLLKGRLEDEGIEAVVHGENIFRIRGAVPLAPETSITVWAVKDEDADRAMQVVEAFLCEVEDAADEPPWTCPRCGEQLDARFTDCWLCGTARPAGPPPAPS